ncbi:type II toxin-antitoxin system PemK/MazF family toxin [Crocosphaera watsonii WH 8501]|uniref:type II toxin-antitoxin system PemK/MazF family toxin n=1 Tax=Crocosphaera watsonii TaxID=263511 RepID=UPI003D303B08
MNLLIFVVVQNNILNQSKIGTVIVCALTTNLRRARAIGNVLLNEEEGNLPEKSVVNVSQIFTVDKRLLSDPIGKLSEERINEIIAGIKLVLESQELV